MNHISSNIDNITSSHLFEGADNLNTSLVSSLRTRLKLTQELEQKRYDEVVVLTKENRRLDAKLNVLDDNEHHLQYQIERYQENEQVFRDQLDDKDEVIKELEQINKDMLVTGQQGANKLHDEIDRLEAENALLNGQLLSSAKRKLG